MADKDQGKMEAYLQRGSDDDGSAVSSSDGSEFLQEDDGAHQDERDEFAEVAALAKRETCRVRIWKAILVTIIAATAALVTSQTYIILTNVEQDDFTTAYELFSSSMSDTLQARYEQLRSAMKSCTRSIAASAEANGETWPFVTMYDFEALGEATRGLSGIENLGYGPYLKAEEKELWNNYTFANQGWTNLSRKIILEAAEEDVFTNYVDGPIRPLFVIPGPPRPLHQPGWQSSPPPFSNEAVNFDTYSTRNGPFRYNITMTLRHGYFGQITTADNLVANSFRREDHRAFHENLITWNKTEFNATDFLHSFVFEPIFKSANDETSEIVGVTNAMIAWDTYTVNLLPEGVNNITLVLTSSCDGSFSYDIRGTSAYYLGAGDRHDPKYNDMVVNVSYYDFGDEELLNEISFGRACVYTFSIYPTNTFEENYRSSLPLIQTIIVGCAFGFMALAFFMYDWFVRSRNQKVTNAAATSNAIVSSMFPGAVRDQLLAQQQKQQQSKQVGMRDSFEEDLEANNMKLHERATTEQIADFYSNCSIMFCDIVGFTAWSSVREPAQVFDLLETVYASFDKIAKRRRIFKVETVGDSYVAVAGLPDPRKDHVTALCRFARDCNYAFVNVVRQLEERLGPETGDLMMRFGVHSGPVTAGVLRGERARFQLFGDTMNTASRMESTGMAGKIQVSHDTAELLKAAGKHSWLTPRNEMIDVKGKGLMVTYWLSGRDGSRGSGSTTDGGSIADSTTLNTSGDGSNDSPEDLSPGLMGDASPTTDKKKQKIESDKTARLVKWNVGMLSRLLQQVVARNAAEDASSAGTALDSASSSSESSISNRSGTVLNEVKEVVPLTHFSTNRQSPDEVELDAAVVGQLEDLVTTIAKLYRGNAFHNFEHASHVTMAMSKLMSRVVNPKIEGSRATNEEGKESLRHDFSYGLTSDPLVRFACVFSAIIHDLDHPGVPNATLVEENSQLAQVYERSIAEQNSFDMAWELFMDDRYAALRSALCGGSGDSELRRFRQIVVNVTLATDIMDKDLNGFRRNRWEKAFGTESDIEEAEKDKADRKATIVIEHMIQASDVAHTMQHWHIYRKWNERFFLETYDAYITGRSDKDPSDNWYESELGFFDFYIIPLAKKLVECGVFGPCADEYLSYAERNRKEWEDKGRQIVEDYVEQAKAAASSALTVDLSRPLAEEIEDLSNNSAA